MAEHTGQAEHDDPDVRKWQDRWEAARDHDAAVREQYASDRRIAAGTVDTSFAVDTNIVGSVIDILVAHLYARDPDVSVRPAETVDYDPATHPMVQAARDQGRDDIAEFLLERLGRDPQQISAQAFAETAQVVCSKQWRRARLKPKAKKMVRSAMTVAIGWIKPVMLTEYKDDPMVATELGDARTTLEQIHAQIEQLEDGHPDADELTARSAEIERTIESLQADLRVPDYRGLHIDFIPAQNVQVSTDVAQIEDYLDATWIGVEQFVPRDDALADCPNLTAEDLKRATTYYQVDTGSDLDPDPMHEQGTGSAGGREDAGQRYTKTQPSARTSSALRSGGGKGKAEEFVKIIEVWHKPSKSILTWVEGVKKWAKDPFHPHYTTSRFFPMFALMFYPVDGPRHPQSLAWRLRKLQEEYSRRRSSHRRVRERSKPGVFFNEGLIDADAMKKVEGSTEQEFIGIKPTDPRTPMEQLFAPKPVPKVDPSLYETATILSDIERLAGVQETKQSSAGRSRQITATEAEIEESGFAMRTQSAIDAIDDILSDLARYTVELCLQAFTLEEVQRMAGAGAVWDETITPERLIDMVDIDIEAGSSGRPNTQGERQAWAQALPLILEVIGNIKQAANMGDREMVRVLTAVLQETMAKLGSRMDIERFIPSRPSPQPTEPEPVPGANGAGAPLPADPAGAQPPPDDEAML